VAPPKSKDGYRTDGAGGGSVARIDSINLPPIERTDEGFLIAPGTRIARTGVQEYTMADGSTQRELRLPKHVFDEASLKTLTGKPLVFGHPSQPVDVSNARALMRGMVASARKDAADDKYVAADIVIYDGNTIHAADRGDARELSAGYRVTPVPIPGGVHRKDGCPYDGTRADVYQTNIKYNHVALLPAGRANEGTRDRPVRLRLDGVGNQLPAQQETPKMVTIKIDGKDTEVTQEVADFAAKLQLRVDAVEMAAKPFDELADARYKALIAEERARADAAEKKLADSEAEAAEKVDEKEVAALFELRKRAETETKLDTAELVKLDAAGLRREILKVRDPGVAAEDLRDDAYVRAYLRQSETKQDSANSMRDPQKKTATKDVDKTDASESVFVKAFAERRPTNQRNAGFKPAN
jgi:hypothetical protein